jgi:hypothetical protein
MDDEERPNGLCLQCKLVLDCDEWCLGYRVASARFGDIPGRYCPKYEHKPRPVKEP